ncbi:MAG: cytochrome C oxidase subunit IV family protein [SAR324 cluster bacterium]|nr:cytochrome C oxidase subunit IV family protein [SAR324 cluster bacterium]
MSQDAAHGNHDARYIKIWGILVVLLAISVAGPMLEIQVITLITAFGIAIVKALMVCAYFMHLNVEKRYIWYMLIISVAFMGIFYFGSAPDVMQGSGTQWKDCVLDKSCVPTNDMAKDSVNYGILR